MTLAEAIEFGMPCVELAQDAEWCEVALETMKKYQELVSVTPHYTDAEIQKMQEMEQAEIQKAYELGKKEVIEDAKG